ncbi:helix-hairpin-helix domain-containing protein [Modestobacter sp. NPDC049651]|uniref:ComEA family DNA-binding protein n=1 Tax=unclassified Modestobacter TaxID=2643866 RepID=UPI0033F72822
MRPSTRRSDDADVIRARLRALLAEGQRSGGWVPDDPGDPDRPDPDDPQGAGDGAEADPDRWETPLTGDPALPVLGRHRAPGRTARVVPGRPAAWALWAAALVAAAAVLGWTWLHRPAVEPVPSRAPEPTAAAAAARPTGSPDPAAPTGTGSAVVVSVVGQVARPGLVTLAPGARVADALAAAGGLLPEADPAAVNAAAVVTDGQQIAVGVPGAAAPAAATPGGPAAGPVDLNTATVADLDALPGVGPVLAQRIVDHRTEHGRFTAIEQLDDVSGIGPALYARLAPLLRV